MTLIVEILISFFLVVGGIFGLVGSYGLIKLQTPMARLHAPTKSTSLGVGGVLIASILYFTFIRGQLSFHELMVTVFLFLTAPITAHFIAKAYLHQNVTPDELPPTGTGRLWAGYEGATSRYPQQPSRHGPDADPPKSYEQR